MNKATCRKNWQRFQSRNQGVDFDDENNKYITNSFFNRSYDREL